MTSPRRTTPRIGVPFCLCLALFASFFIGAVRAAAAPSRTSAVQWAAAMLSAMNSERAEHGLAPLQARPGLVKIAYNHNVWMGRYDLASHQLPGELPYRTRITKSGYAGNSGGENLAQSTDWTLAGAYQVQRAMYAETSASDGRHENIVNPAFRYVGVDVAIDIAHHKLWVTQDFSAGAPAAAPSSPTPDMATSMLAAMNSERAAHRVAPLRMNSLLIRSASGHNGQMALFNEMSHQLPRELFFLNRILSTGYRPSTAGEDVGWTSEWTLSALYDLQRQMYNEIAPNDGHRQNILNSSFREVGIAIYLDAAHHKLWFTQDFGRPS